MAALSACEVVQPRPSEPPPQTKTPTATSGAAAAPRTAPAAIKAPAVRHDLPSLVRYSAWLWSQSAEALKSMQPSVDRLSQDSGSPLDQLHLAILLSVPNAPFRDESRARTLLTGLLQSDNKLGDSLQTYARFLLWNLNDRSWARGACEKALDGERAQRALLQHKLNELKAIEEQLDRRDLKH